MEIWMLFFNLFWSLTACGHYMNILLNVSFSVSLKKYSHTGLDQHEGE